MSQSVKIEDPAGLKMEAPEPPVPANGEIEAQTTTELKVKFARGVVVFPDPLRFVVDLQAKQEDDPDDVGSYREVMADSGVYVDLRGVRGEPNVLTITESVQIVAAVMKWGGDLGKDIARTLTSAGLSG